MSTTTSRPPNTPTDGRPDYRARRWPLRIMVIVFVAVVVGLVAWLMLRDQAPGYTTLPVPSISAPSQPGSSSGSAGGAAEGSGGSAGSAGSAVSAPGAKLAAIPPARATQIYIPNSNPDLVISTPVSPMNGCKKVIDPPRDPKRFGGVYGCSDFAQPGTDTPSLAVLAGHSDKFKPTAFNRLYEQKQSLAGRDVFLKTAASGDKWLV